MSLPQGRDVGVSPRRRPGRGTLHELEAPIKRDTLIWIGGALLVVLGVALWLVLTAPEGNALAESYRFGVL